MYLCATFPALSGDADEILQDFAQDRILREGWLAKANQKRGRFRNFLKTSLRNFVHDRLRGQPQPLVSLEQLDLDPPAEEARSIAFDLNWARTILSEVLQRMEADCRKPGRDQPRRTHVWLVFRSRLLAQALEGTQPVPYEELVRTLGIVSPADAQNMLATAKRIFTRHLYDVIAEYEDGQAAIEDELADLKAFLMTLQRPKSCRSTQDLPGANV
jgi:hypothetical protein